MIFVMKYRRGVLDADMLRCCEDAMRKVCGYFGVDLREFNGEDDHVHLLAKYPPLVAVAGLVNSLKGVSTQQLRPQFTSRVNRPIMHAHFWPPPYLAAPCGDAPLSIIWQYIEQQ